MATCSPEGIHNGGFDGDLIIEQILARSTLKYGKIGGIKRHKKGDM